MGTAKIVQIAWKYGIRSQVFTWFQIFCQWQNIWNQVKTWKIWHLVFLVKHNPVPIPVGIRMAAGILACSRPAWLASAASVSASPGASTSDAHAPASAASSSAAASPGISGRQGNNIHKKFDYQGKMINSQNVQQNEGKFFIKKHRETFINSRNVL